MPLNMHTPVWKPAEDLRAQAFALGLGHGIVLLPLFTDVDEDGDEIPVVFYQEEMTPESAQMKMGGFIPALVIAMPAMCGHYKCGRTIEVCLN